MPSHASPPAAAPRRAAPAIGPIATAASHRAEAAPAAPPAALPAVASPSRSASRAEAEARGEVAEVRGEGAEARGEVRQLAHRCDELGAIQLGLDRALEASSAALRSGQEALRSGQEALGAQVEALEAQGRDLEAQVAQQGRESVAVAQSVLALQCQLGNLQHATTEAVSELWGAQASKPQPRAPLEAALHSERDAHAATAARVARVEAELAASVSQQYRLQQQLLLMQSAQAAAPSTSAPPSPQCWPTTANKGV